MSKASKVKKWNRAKAVKCEKRDRAIELFDWFEKQYFDPRIHDYDGIHWTLRTNGEQIGWWPGNNKWYFRGKTYSGDLADFVTWIKKTKP